MKFSCIKTLLLEAVSTVSRVIASKANLPAEEGILFNVYEDGNIRLAGVGQETGLECFISAAVESTGDFVVNAKKFGDFLRNLRDDEITLSTEGDMLSMVCGVVSVKLPVIKADLFPDLPLMEKKRQFNMQPALFLDMVKKTAFAAAGPEGKEIQQGVLFEMENGVLNMVATDTFRLAIRQEPVEGMKENVSFIVPKRAMEILETVMPADGDNVNIGIGERHVSFEFGRKRIVSRLIKGEFLKYKTAIPSSFKTKTVVNREQIRKSVGLASILVSEKMRYPIRFSIDADTLVISFRASEGSVVDEMKIQKEGDSLEIGFNNRYLESIFSSIETENIIMRFNSPLSPMAVEDENGKFYCLLSAMRLRNE